MKEAIGMFNNWSCPTCKRFIAQPKYGDTGKCKSCGEELFFSVKQLKEKEKVGTSIPDGRYHLVKAEEIPEGPCEAGQNLGLSLGEILIKYLLKSEEQQKLEEIKKLGMKAMELDSRYTLVNFTNKPYLFKWLQKFDSKNRTLSETIISFTAKGVRKYLEEKEAKKAP